MDDKNKVSRRNFVKACSMMSGAVALNPSLLAASGQPLQQAHAALLTDPAGAPVDGRNLLPGKSYVFHYPYATTPCFLLNLGRRIGKTADLETESGDRYSWNGGVGPDGSIVAFSAICAHKMSYPTRRVSFINYRHDGMPGTSPGQSQRPVIYCCSEGSVYDPADGARVLSGPAPQPLAAVALDYDNESGQITAAGVYGGDMFRQFFDEFGFQLALETRSSDVNAFVGTTSTVWPIEEYCTNPAPC
ncbi:MAG: twin-arginine translocation signal domain-containing protein [Chromatiales bacterium]|nr:twin-arginine translocation signal domain-containing protein [Chromatiales bacterium]